MNQSPFHTNPGGIFLITDARRPNAAGKRQIDDGDCIELHTNTDSLYVEGVELLGNGHGRGRAAFFAHSPEDTLHGITLGEVVEFETRHVFGCHAT